MIGKVLRNIAATSVVILGMNAGIAQAADAICYNCPPQWADWASQLKAIKKHLGYDIPHDNKNSGQTLSQLLAEKAARSPMSPITASRSAFRPAKRAWSRLQAGNWDDIPDGLKDPDGHWFTIHSGALGLFINVDALGGKPVPTSWADLLKPEYKGMVGYLDPSSAFVGYAGAVAVNRALGGSLENFDPAIEYFKKLERQRSRSCRSRRPMPGCCPVKSRSCSTMISTPTGRSTRTRQTWCS